METTSRLLSSNENGSIKFFTSCVKENFVLIPLCDSMKGLIISLHINLDGDLYMARKTIDERLSEAAERLKKLRAQKAQQEARARSVEKKRERTEDTNRKIRLGGLVVLAGLADVDKGVLLGGLLELAKQQVDEQFVSRCKSSGDSLLAHQAAVNKQSAAAQTQE